MMPQNILATVLVSVLVGGVFICATTVMVRYYKERQQQQQKELELLVTRCYKIIDLLNILPDRYLPLLTKTLLVEYLVASMNTIARFKADNELPSYLPRYLEWLQELQEGQQVSSKDKVQTAAQLTQVQAALQAVPVLLKGLVHNKVMDSATAKEQVASIRYSYCLAHHDLLLQEAQLCLDDDKRARALEKMRLALTEMEKVASSPHAEPVITQLSSRIAQIEQELFGKKPRAS